MHKIINKMNKKKSTVIKLISIALLIGAGFLIFGDEAKPKRVRKKMTGPCFGRQWDNPTEQRKCLFPDPPIGRWKAVYSKAFAEVHKLPKENISTDLSPGVDYMEMDVQPYGDGGTACLVNMLIKKPNDMALYRLSNPWGWGPDLHARRKLAHLIDLDSHKDKLETIGSIGVGVREIKRDRKRGYYRSSSWSFYIGNILSGYNYISADAGCHRILADDKLFPDGWALIVNKASVWGRHEVRFKNMDDPGWPRGKAYHDSMYPINIPHELITYVFKDMPIGGRYE